MVKHIKKKLEEVIDEAKVRLDIETAQNPELRRAIKIVESFLQRTGRVCYGGQAINAQLPKKDQFYNPEKALPDYDFFSPNGKEDVDSLINEFKNAGYTEISKRIGIHEGTSKIYINFTAIADITQVIPDFYENIYKKSVSVNGIHYADPIFLRMMMYLELSRPRGEVERWDKVYDRLKKLDNAHHLPKCRASYSVSRAASIARPILIKYMINNRRVFMGADVELLYKKGTRLRSAKSRTRFLLHGTAPVIFMSSDADMDADALVQSTMARKVQIIGYQNILPAMVALYHGDELIGLIVQEEACHSIITLPVTKQRQLRVASLDTILTFLIGLYYRDDPIIMTQEALLCWLRQYIDLSNWYKMHPTKLVPAFSIECSGYQTTFASLLRAKGARIEAARQKVSSGDRMTRKTHSKARTTMTRRRTV